MSSNYNVNTIRQNRESMSFRFTISFIQNTLQRRVTSERQQKQMNSHCRVMCIFQRCIATYQHLHKETSDVDYETKNNEDSRRNLSIKFATFVSGTGVASTVTRNAKFLNTVFNISMNLSAPESATSTFFQTRKYRRALSLVLSKYPPSIPKASRRARKGQVLPWIKRFISLSFCNCKLRTIILLPIGGCASKM